MIKVIISLCLVFTQGLPVSSYERPDTEKEFIFCLNEYVEPQGPKELKGDPNGQYAFPRFVDMDLVKTFKEKSILVNNNTDKQNKRICDCIDEIMGYLNEKTGCNFHVPTVYFFFEQCITRCLHEDYKTTQKFLNNGTIDTSLDETFTEKCAAVFFATFGVNKEQMGIRIPIQTPYFSSTFQKTLSLLLSLYLDNAKIQREKWNYEALCEISLKDRSPVSLFLSSKYPESFEVPEDIKNSYKKLGQAICRQENNIDECTTNAIDSFSTLLDTVRTKAQRVSVIMKLFSEAIKKLKVFYSVRRTAEYNSLATQTVYLNDGDFKFQDECKNRFLKKINVTSYEDLLESLKRESRTVASLIKLWHRSLAVYYDLETKMKIVSQTDICDVIRATKFNDVVNSMLTFRRFYLTNTYEPSHLKTLVGYAYYTRKVLDI